MSRETVRRATVGCWTQAVLAVRAQSPFSVDKAVIYQLESQTVKTSAPTKRLLTAFDDLHKSAFGERALISAGRDAKLLADLWQSHQELLEPLMAEFFRERDPWVLSTMGMTVKGFQYRFAALLAKHAPRLRQASAEDWREECARVCNGRNCATQYLHELWKP